MWCCYILRNRLFPGQTYNGSTNNMKRRLRQHNEELAGGARYTKGKGGKWEICAVLCNLPDHINALSCEWRMKCPIGRPGRRSKQYQGVEGRIRSLNLILPLEYWTKQCVVNNRNSQLRLYVASDLCHLIDKFTLPANIQMISKETICPDLLKEEKKEEEEEEEEEKEEK